MEDAFVNLPDTFVVKEEELFILNAQLAVKAIKKLNHVELIECRKSLNGWEYVVFTTKLYLPQYGIVADIRNEERIAVGFEVNDNQVPEVFALRKGFPANLPHLSLREFEEPKALCIYDVPYEEVKLTFTLEIFIERIRNWLSLNAVGKLHQADQMLEPFILEDDGVFICPRNITTQLFLGVEEIGKFNCKPILRASQTLPENCKYIMLYYEGKALPHGLMSHKPKSIFDMAEFLERAEINFKDELVKCLRLLKNLHKLNCKIIFGVVLPKVDNSATQLKGVDSYAFLTDDTIQNIGLKLGLWQEFERQLADILVINDSVLRIENLMTSSIKTLKPFFSFSRIDAQILNKLSLDSRPTHILQIGVGALGSQVFNNFYRQGYGRWTIIDDDAYFPHNLARHALPVLYIGKNKAESIVALANETLNETEFSSGLTINALASESQEIMNNAIENSDVVFDFSASVAVARHLNSIKKAKRIVSCFLNPKGTDLVIIAEDIRRKHQIDYLEVIYYRALYRDNKLKNHLSHKGEKVRFAKSCHDLSFQIPQENLAIHSGIATAALKKIVLDKNESIQLWSKDDLTFSVSHFFLSTSKVNYKKAGEWKVYYDNEFLHSMEECRKLKLPVETGGIIIGSYDVSRKKIYLADVIASPPDSEEYPCLYKRGIKGLDKLLEELENVTANNLRYVGEWHSHPDDCSVNPSEDDKKNFEWIRQIMKNEGLPPLSFIVGEKNKHSVFIETMG